MRTAIVITFVCFLFTAFSQTITYSPEYGTERKNVPVRILNSDSAYFYVLRYNKVAHDFHIEKRSKPEAKMLSFIPLRLETVNKSWFNFENLDYIFTEHNHRLYFIFEKVENSHRAIFVKTIDSLGKASDFKEIAAIDLDKSMKDSKFYVSLTNDHRLLIVGRQDYLTGVSKKVAMLYNLEAGSTVWTKALPAEDANTGYSSDFTCNGKNDLFYIVSKPYVSGYKRKAINQGQFYVPVIACHLVKVAAIFSQTKIPVYRIVPFEKPFYLKNTSLFPADEKLVFTLYYAKMDVPGNDSVFFRTECITADFEKSVSTRTIPLSALANKQLTFFDGTDYSGASDKDYTFCAQNKWNSALFTVLERREKNYFKELLVWKTNLDSATVSCQKIIPRKIFYFDDRTRFRELGATAQVAFAGDHFTFVLEDQKNSKANPDDFRFHDFSKQKYLWDGNLAAYCLRADGRLEKKILYTNSRFDFVPLHYSSSGQRDFVFYMNSGKTEKFGFVYLNTL